MTRAVTFLITSSSCEFVYECPMKWDALAPTAVPNVRHCGHCQKDVTLCESQEQFDQLAEAGACVAVYIRESVGTMRVGLPSPAGAKVAAFIDGLPPQDFADRS